MRIAAALIPALLASLVTGAAVWFVGRSPAERVRQAPVARVIPPVRSARRPGPAARPPEIGRGGPDRIQLRRADGTEWIFARNPLDPSRVSATLIDRKRRLLIEHSESELASLGLARGWADVAGLGQESAGDPRERFPDYEVVDVADHREALHARSGK